MATEDLCIVCGREGVPIYARSLCRRDYKRDLVKRKEGQRVVDNFAAIASGGDVFSEGEPLRSLLGADPDPETETPVVESTPYSSAERPPGAVGTPSQPRVSAGPEVRPQPPGGKIKGFFSRKDKEQGSPGVTPPASREKRPSVVRGRRVSAAETIGDLWAGMGGVAVRTGTHAPLGRCLQWQAPVAGEMLDDVVKDTFIDKVALQKVVKGRAKFDLLGAVIGPPLLVLAIERNPQNAQALMPMLASSIRHSLPLMVPAIKKAKEKERKMAEAAADLFADDPDFPQGEDPVAYILGLMFDGWTPAPPPQRQDVPEEPVSSV